MNLSEKCSYCNEIYIPKRKGAQKFCSNSCRSKNWKLKQIKQQQNGVVSIISSSSEVANTNSNNKITAAGIGNAAIGVATIEALKSIVTPTNKKPATKEDISKLSELILGQRYFQVNNLPPNRLGHKPYYDMDIRNIVYLNF